MTEKEAFVGLNLIPHIGSTRLKNLLAVFGSPQEIFCAKYRHLAEVCGIGENIAAQIVSFKQQEIAKEIDLAQELGIDIITCADAHYPQNLKAIPGAPILLYVCGSLQPADDLAVGIVGSRRASFYGLNNAGSFAAQLCGYGITIVSGLARGVDTFAHRGALKSGGRTIAVIGSGFKHIYPQENAGLAKEIAEHGAVISEFSLETKPLPVNFPRRNRLISGLSLGVLITEAARNSGALITADFALEQGREVFAIPGRIDSLGSMGTNALIQQGAKAVTCCQDIIEELPTLENLAQTRIPLEEKEINLSQEERIYSCIGRQPSAIDELVRESGLPCSRVLGLLLNLRLKKLIRILPGQQYMRN